MIDKRNSTGRTTPIPVFMSSEYRELIDRLTKDAEKHGLKPTNPPVSRFTTIVRMLEDDYRYSAELGMFSGSEALRLIEATLADFIDYPVEGKQ